MEKGEIARYEQFLLFSQRFQKTCNADTQKPGLVSESVNPYYAVLGFFAARRISLVKENTANNKDFLVFQNVCLTYPTKDKICHISYA